VGALKAALAAGGTGPAAPVMDVPPGWPTSGGRRRLGDCGECTALAERIARLLSRLDTAPEGLADAKGVSSVLAADSTGGAAAVAAVAASASEDPPTPRSPPKSSGGGGWGLRSISTLRRSLTMTGVGVSASAAEEKERLREEVGVLKEAAAWLHYSLVARQRA